MGCDIHVYAERKGASGDFETVDGLDVLCHRNYGVFGFLAGVRNYSEVTPISEPRGLPVDASADVVRQAEYWDGDGHSHSWLSVDELCSFNYDAEMEDRRVTRQLESGVFSGACTAEPGDGSPTTYRNFLGSWFFDDLKKLQEVGAARIVFWFDN